jgi:hypothetical protein
MFNLGMNEDGKGPYLVRQVGYPPGSTEMKVDPYILQNDGVWIISYHFATLPKEEQTKRLFQSRRGLIKLLEEIGAHEVECIDTLPEGLSNDEVLRRYKENAARLFRHVARDQAECIVAPTKK